MMQHKSSEPRPQISVVIPAYNEEKYLGDTIENVKTAIQEFHKKYPLAVEIVVVNNNSTDRTEQVALAHGARVVFEGKNQIAASRNAGGRAACGEIVAFLDADDHISPNLLSVMYEAMASGQYIGGGVANIHRDNIHPLAFILERVNDVVRRFSGLSTGFIYTFKKTFDEIGGFDERYYAAEEGKFVIALKAKGKTLGQKFCNIEEGYVVKSARKFQQVKSSTLVWTALQFFINPRRLRDKKACSFWYDIKERL